MKVEMIEKGSDSITVKFIAESGQEAMILAMAKLKPKSVPIINSVASPYSEYVQFGSWEAEVIESMRKVKEPTS